MPYLAESEWNAGKAGIFMDHGTLGTFDPEEARSKGWGCHMCTCKPAVKRALYRKVDGEPGTPGDAFKLLCGQSMCDSIIETMWQ